jgi:glycerate kinase
MHLGAKIIAVKASDPMGRELDVSIQISKDCIAIIEMSEVCGLKLMKPEELNPLHFSTEGLGVLIRDALKQGAKKILLCIGGSCSTDGASGALRELGLRFLDKGGKELADLPEDLIRLEALDSAALETVNMDILCDVDNKLLGDQGAARVFGPQKGADAAAVARLEACLEKFDEISFRHKGIRMSEIKYGGAAGGVAAGLASFLGARLVDGAGKFLDYTGFDQELKKADLVITGEGSLDEQTLAGKAPFAVAVRAKKLGLPVTAMAGRVPLSAQESLSNYFDVLLAIGNEPTDMATALMNTGSNLTRTARTLGNMLAMNR